MKSLQAVKSLQSRILICSDVVSWASHNDCVFVEVNSMQ